MISGRKRGDFFGLACGCGHEPMRITYLGVDSTLPHLRLDCEACGRHSVVKLRNARAFPQVSAERVRARELDSPA